MNWYRPLSLSSLKSSIHHFAHLVRSWHHHASILWLDTERPYIKLLSLENESRELLRRNRWIPARKCFLYPNQVEQYVQYTPQNIFLQRQVHCLKYPLQATQFFYCSHLFSRVCKIQTVSAYQNRYCAIRNSDLSLFFFDAFAVLTPSRSKILCVCLTVSLATTMSWSTTSLCHIDR